MTTATDAGDDFVIDTSQPPPWPYDRCQICVSLAAPDLAALRAKMHSVDGADLIEVRLDSLDDPLALSSDDLHGIVIDAPVPVGFTLRPKWQGGGYVADEEERRALLEIAAASGAAFVDVELDADWVEDFLAAARCPVVVSHHWQEPRPPDLDLRVQRVRQLRPSVAKLVATAESPAEALPLLQAGRGLAGGGQRATCFCMGSGGAASRLLAVGDAGAIMYAAPSAAEAVAPGQWTVDRLVNEFRVPGWATGTEFCGLIGHPISHSLSPAMFNAVFQEQGVDLAYVPLAGPKLAPVIDFAEQTAVRGLSVTMPFKEEMAARCVELDPLAEKIGAVNTVVATAEGWVGYNTDATAIVEAAETVAEVSGASVVALVGAGGAARAAAVALRQAGSEVTVFNRTAERADAVAQLAGTASAPLEQLAERRFDIVINATPVGMLGGGAEAEAPFPVEWLEGTEVVVDLVYRPRRTVLLREAAARGCTTVDGLEMFVRQAAAQYCFLTGDRSIEPLDALRAAALEALGENAG